MNGHHQLIRPLSSGYLNENTHVVKYEGTWIIVYDKHHMWSTVPPFISSHVVEAWEVDYNHFAHNHADANAMIAHHGAYNDGNFINFSSKHSIAFNGCSCTYDDCTSGDSAAFEPNGVAYDVTQKISSMAKVSIPVVGNDGFCGGN